MVLSLRFTAGPWVVWPSSTRRVPKSPSCRRHGHDDDGDCATSRRLDEK